MNEAIEKMMKILGCSEDEARQLVADDAAIDKGENRPLSSSSPRLS